VPGLKRYSKLSLMLVIAVSAGFAVAGIVSAAVVPRPTLQVAQHASVTDQAQKTTVESIVVNGRGRAVYQLSGDSVRHPNCTQANGCFQFWPPVTVAPVKSLHKAATVSGKLGSWRRTGFLQVTLNGHPLYTFFRDKQPHAATGEGVISFKGTWHVLREKSTSPSQGTPTTTTPSSTSTTTGSPSTSTTSSSSSTSTTTSSTSTTPCRYPPCY
jgi:predicted lipoprotein with Yx(FWY)xxD motif